LGRADGKAFKQTACALDRDSRDAVLARFLRQASHRGCETQRCGRRKGSGSSTIAVSNHTSVFDSKFALDAPGEHAERFGMAEFGHDEPAKLQVILERVDPARNVARYYVLSVEQTLFACDALICRRGRIGSAGRPRLQSFRSGGGAGLTLEAWLERKRRGSHAVK
jgi:predicted DNA-binding WGR domain protein